MATHAFCSLKSSCIMAISLFNYNFIIYFSSAFVNAFPRLLLILSENKGYGVVIFVIKTPRSKLTGYSIFVQTGIVKHAVGQIGVLLDLRHQCSR